VPRNGILRIILNRGNTIIGADPIIVNLVRTIENNIFDILSKGI